MDRQRMERCLEQVAAYQASGLKAKAWAEANGVALGTRGSWCAHARRWQRRLDGVEAAPSVTGQTNGFVAARVGPSTAPTSVRIELSTGSTRLELHWPLAHTRELAALLRELSQ